MKYYLTTEGVELFFNLIDAFDSQGFKDSITKASKFLRKYYLGPAYELRMS